MLRRFNGSGNPPKRQNPAADTVSNYLNQCSYRWSRTFSSLIPADSSGMEVLLIDRLISRLRWSAFGVKMTLEGGLRMHVPDSAGRSNGAISIRILHVCCGVSATKAAAIGIR